MHHACSMCMHTLVPGYVLTWELPWLAQRHESTAKCNRQWGSKNKSPGLKACSRDTTT